MEVNEGDQTIHWHERCLSMPSIDGSLAAQACVQERLAKAEKAIGELMVRTHSTPQLTNRVQVEEQVPSILSSLHVEGVLHVHIRQGVAEQPVRASQEKQLPPRRIWSIQVSLVERNVG